MSDSPFGPPGPDPRAKTELPDLNHESALELQAEVHAQRVAKMRNADVRGQLRRARSSRWLRWRRDPGRELALLVLLGAALGTLLVFSVGWKQQRFQALGQSPDATFWMESAQRFRYVRMVANGEEIPSVDARMQAPDGYATQSDTIAQEQLYGRIVREVHARAEAAGRPPPEPAAVVRTITRWLSASTLFPIALLGLALTRRRDAALVAAAAYAFALPVVERGTGSVLFREDVAVPMLAWHLALLAVWTRRPRHLPPGPEVLRPLVALASGVALAAALLLWKVIAFYLVLLAGFFATALLLDRESPRRVAVGFGAVLTPVVAACFLPAHLQHDGFLTSTSMLVCAGVLVAALGASVTRVSPVAWLVAAAGGCAAARLALPAEAGLGHAWETIVAKVRFLDQKPEDPSRLSFHARHYWTGNYFSPTLRRLLRDWPPLLLAAAPGLVLVARWWWTRGGRLAEIEPDRPPPTKLLETDGAAVPLGASGSHFVVWMVIAFGVGYLLFVKLQLFAAVALAALVAVGFAGVTRGRTSLRAAMVLALVGIATHGWGALAGLDRLLPPPEGRSRVVVFPPDSMNRMATMVDEHVGPDEPILASFIVSPFLLAYLDRPTVLHCFFEGDLLPRFREVVEARFQSEEQLAEVARRYGAGWYLHEAHHVLRTDPRMSQRYVAGAMDWPSDAAVTAMSFAPERLKHFELVAEDGFFRLFRVRETPGRGRAARRGGALWNRPLFTALFGDPLGPTRARDDGLSPEHLLHIEQEAQRFLDGAGVGGFAEREWSFQRAVETAPYRPEPHEELAALYAERGRTDRAARHRARASLLRAVWAGRATLPEDAVPAPIPLRD